MHSRFEVTVGTVGFAGYFETSLRGKRRTWCAYRKCRVAAFSLLGWELFSSKALLIYQLILWCQALTLSFSSPAFSQRLTSLRVLSSLLFWKNLSHHTSTVQCTRIHHDIFIHVQYALAIIMPFSFYISKCPFSILISLQNNLNPTYERKL